MSDPTQPISNERDVDDPRLVEAVQGYVAEFEAGRRPNRQKWIARYPDIANELSACLQGLAFVDSVAAQLNDAWKPSDPSLRAAEPDALLGQPLGDFRLIREIGRGGMGIVYEAVQISLGRMVAVKVLPFAAALDPRHLPRFRNEAQMAAQLHHTNIVPVYAVGCERSVHFYAMQLIEGQSLAESIHYLRDAAGRSRNEEAPTVSLSPTVTLGSSNAAAGESSATGGLTEAQAKLARLLPPISSDASGSQSFTDNLSSLRRGRRLSYFQAVARLGVQAALALDHAHQTGVIHRDIKPANLLLDGRGTLWVTDFGLAQLYAESELTQPGDLLGTFRYMSPEQASGNSAIVDQRTDIHSLGVTLYEMLTLERAVRGHTREAMLYQIEVADPVPPRRIDRTIPVELEIIVGKAMAKSPADRYPSARAMADDLERFLRGEPIRARPPTLRDKAFKWVRRHRTFALATFAGLALATVGLLISTILVSREQQRTAAAYASEHSERLRADRSSAMAHQAVAYFSAVAEDEFPKTLQFYAIKRDMLETAMRYYQAFLADRGSDASAKPALDAARARIASILESLQEVGENHRLEFDLLLLQQQHAVQTELKLTPTQMEQLAQVKVGPPTTRPMFVPHPTTMMTDAMRNEFRAAIATRRDALTNLLTPAQLTRMRHISRQLRGVAAFSDPDVADALKLDDDQKERFSKLARSDEAMNHPTAPAELPDEIAITRQRETLAAALTQLTDVQRTAWAALVGAPFTGELDLPEHLPGGGTPPPLPPDFGKESAAPTDR